MVHGALAPPSLACLGAHDGLADAYRAGCYHGGIPCDFFPGYWWYQNRFINRFPASGPPREQDTDLTGMLAAHPTYDDFWRERSALEVLDKIRVPLYSSGVWGKMQLHTRGNIDGYLRASGPKKLRMSGGTKRLGGGGRIFQRRIPQKRAAAVLRLLSQRQEYGLSGAAERAVPSARRQRHAQRRNLAAAGHRVYALVPQRR